MRALLGPDFRRGDSGSAGIQELEYRDAAFLGPGVRRDDNGSACVTVVAICWLVGLGRRPGFAQPKAPCLGAGCWPGRF